ncbi:MAG: hypothetical protein ACE5J5_03785 [Candidatus Hydrothermarchaeales archaeon]
MEEDDRIIIGSIIIGLAFEVFIYILARDVSGEFGEPVWLSVLFWQIFIIPLVIMMAVIPVVNLIPYLVGFLFIDVLFGAFVGIFSFVFGVIGTVYRAIGSVLRSAGTAYSQRQEERRRERERMERQIAEEKARIDKEKEEIISMIKETASEGGKSKG